MSVRDRLDFSQVSFEDSSYQIPVALSPSRFREQSTFHPNVSNSQSRINWGPTVRLVGGTILFWVVVGVVLYGWSHWNDLTWNRPVVSNIDLNPIPQLPPHPAPAVESQSSDGGHSLLSLVVLVGMGAAFLLPPFFALMRHGSRAQWAFLSVFGIMMFFLSFFLMFMIGFGGMTYYNEGYKLAFNFFFTCTCWSITGACGSMLAAAVYPSNIPQTPGGLKG